MQVNFVTRRGSNDWHGRVFEDFRNAALNANSWMNNAEQLPRNPLILNEFGGGVGGEIVRDRLFFFGSFAMAKEPGGHPASNTFLTTAAQQGIYTMEEPGQFVYASGATTRLVFILEDLKREGMAAEAANLEAKMRARAERWHAEPYPFGSEMPWDSTGQEEVYAWMKYFGYPDKADVTLNAILSYDPTIPHWGYNGSRPPLLGLHFCGEI